MAEHEFGEILEMIIYVVLFSAIVFYISFLDTMTFKITYSYDYPIGEISSYAQWLVRSSNLTLQSLGNTSIPYVIDVDKLIKCKTSDLSCTSTPLPSYSSLSFVLPAYGGEEQFTFYKRFYAKEIEDKGELLFKERIPILHYHKGEYLSGYVEVILYDSSHSEGK